MVVVMVGGGRGGGRWGVHAEAWCYVLLEDDLFCIRGLSQSGDSFTNMHKALEGTDEHLASLRLDKMHVYQLINSKTTFFLIPNRLCGAQYDERAKRSVSM